MSVKEFISNFKILVSQDRLRDVSEVLLHSLMDHEKFNEAILLCSQIDEYLKLHYGKRLSADNLQVRKNDLEFRLLQFIDNIQFSSDWQLSDNVKLKFFSNINRHYEESVLPTSLKYGCNRNKNVEQFYKWFTSLEGKIQFYVIHGEEKESPFGFYQRIGLQEIPFFVDDIKSPPAPIHLKAIGENLKYYKIFILRELFSSLNISIPKIDISNTNIEVLLDSPMVKVHNTVVISFKKYLTEWSQSSPKVIEWFVNDFCNVKLPDSAPKFIFFLQLIYPNTNNFFSKIANKRLKRKCRKDLDQINKAKWFNELQMVHKEDINIWLDKVTHDAGNKDDWFEEYFSSNKTYHMSFVEKQLSKIIYAYNNDKNTYI